MLLDREARQRRRPGFTGAACGGGVCQVGRDPNPRLQLQASCKPVLAHRAAAAADGKQQLCWGGKALQCWHCPRSPGQKQLS